MENVVLTRELMKIFHSSFEDASEAITRLLQKELKIGAVEVSFFEPNEVISYIGNSFSTMYGVLIQLTYGLEGNVMMFISKDNAFGLANKLNLDESILGDFLQEFFNILVSYICIRMSKIIEDKVEHTPPEVVYDYAGSIIEPVVMSMLYKDDNPVVFNVDYLDDAMSFKLVFIIYSDYFAKLKDMIGK